MILAYMPTYSPDTEADTDHPRHFTRLAPDRIKQRTATSVGRIKPWVYMDAIDSVLNARPGIDLIVVDGKSTESIRDALKKHNAESGGYTLELYPEKMSQWILFNDVMEKYSTAETKYFVYTSSDVIWDADWVEEAIKEFEKDPKLQILFPMVSTGDGNIPCQVSPGLVDRDPSKAPYDRYGRAPVLNAYVAIFRMDFLRAYGGYPTLFRNCYTESFLHYLCEAIGGEMRLLHRGWCFHWGTVDIWQKNGSFYHYDEEKALFEATMNKVQMASAAGMLTVDLLKKTLWKQNLGG